MDSCVGLGLSPPTLSRLNFCQLWLQVTQLSDICTLPGDGVDRNAWLGIAPMPSSDANWPVQPRPHDTVWGLWRRALSDSACSKLHRHAMATRPGALTAPLGNWSSDFDPQASPKRHSCLLHSTQCLFVPVRNQPATLQQLSAPTCLAFSLACYDR